MLARYFDSMAKRNPFEGWFSSQVHSDLFSQVFESHDDVRVDFDEKQTLISIDIPGVHPKDVEITCVDQCITVKRTLRGKTYTNSYNIHRDYDASATKATVENGVLEMRIPRSICEKGKKINIEIK